MSDNEVLMQLAKTQEGIMLGLGAMADYLKKMDARLSKEDEEDEEEEMEKMAKLEKEAADVQKASLVKEITESVIAAIKQGGMDVEGREPEKVGGKDQWPMSGRPAAEDKETPATLRTATADVQKPIQAMQKQGFEEEEEVLPVPAPEEEEGAEEYPEEEDRVETPEQMMRLSKQVKQLKKALADNQASVTQQVQKELKAQLQKIGYREEKNLQAPYATNILGTDGVQITKSVSGDVTDELAQMSYRQLGELRERVLRGDKENIPAELLPHL